MTGEYVAEYRRRDGDGWFDWRPVPDLDPVPDHDDLATERAAHDLRMTVAKLNRINGPDYQYRTRYVPDDPGDAYTDAWSPGGR